jgi:hypothetical protein
MKKPSRAKSSRVPKGARGEAAAGEPGTTVAASLYYRTREDGSRARTLLKPIRGHGVTITEIVLRKPMYRDIMDFGDPKMLIILDAGMTPMHDMTIVEKYIARLSGVDALLLEQCDGEDALALRDAVLSFFSTRS